MDTMLMVAICLAGIFVILQAGEYLYRKKILKGEYLRKFVHISSAVFIASWPWLISWRWIELIGLSMLAVVMFNHRSRTFHMDGNIERQTYGGMIFAIAVIACALMTHEKVFFMIAMLQMGLADGLAAVAGQLFKKTRYKIFGQYKSVAGTMAFWLVSLFVLGFGVPFANQLIDYHNYVVLIVALPIVLTILENVSGRGFDNLTVPVATVIALRLFS